MVMLKQYYVIEVIGHGKILYVNLSRSGTHELIWKAGNWATKPAAISFLEDLKEKNNLLYLQLQNKDLNIKRLFRL